MGKNQLNLGKWEKIRGFSIPAWCNRFFGNHPKSKFQIYILLMKILNNWQKIKIPKNFQAARKNFVFSVAWQFKISFN